MNEDQEREAGLRDEIERLESKVRKLKEEIEALRLARAELFWQSWERGNEIERLKAVMLNQVID